MSVTVEVIVSAVVMAAQLLQIKNAMKINIIFLLKFILFMRARLLIYLIINIKLYPALFKSSLQTSLQIDKLGSKYVI